VISTPFVHGPLQLKERWKLGRALRGMGYAQAIVLPNSWKSALIPFFADIPIRSGYVGESRYGLLNLTYPHDKRNPRPMVEHYAALAEMPGKDVARGASGARVGAGESAGVGASAHAPKHVSAHVSARPSASISVNVPTLRASSAQSLATLRALGLVAGSNAEAAENAHGKGDSEALPENPHETGVSSLLPRIAVLAPGAEFGPAKRWPAAHFADVARTFHAQGVRVCLVGSAKDQAVGDEIVKLSEGAATNLCGLTTLDEAIDVIAAAEVVVSNDSGLMHVAAALERPQVAVFGSSSSTHTPPLSALARIAEIPVNTLPCRPCFARECPLGHSKCLNDLPPAAIMALMPETIRPASAR
jgi:heptosyltransferase II